MLQNGFIDFSGKACNNVSNIYFNVIGYSEMALSSISSITKLAIITETVAHGGCHMFVCNTSLYKTKCYPKTEF